MLARRIGRADRSLLRRKRCALTRSAETKRSGTLPAQRIAGLVGDGHDRVIERGLNEHKPVWDVLAFTLFEFLTLTRARFAGFLLILCLGHLFGRFLFAGNRALAGTLARAGVGMGTLSANRQSAPMTEAAVGLNLD